jgi:multiple sugar transport system ATP-binding protein
VAVDDLSLSVKPGELLVLLGPSGCGKSTTLRLIAGLELPTHGSVEIGGAEVTNKFPRDRGISMVFQSYALYPHKTVRGNLRFPLQKMDLSKAEIKSKIESVAEMLEIADILDRRPSEISGGQQQRVAVGRTVVREPDVFLMDEPLSNLDAKLRVQTRAELRKLQQQLGTTTIYVTHDQEEALSLADRVAVMQHGDLQQIGTPEEVYETPANKFVASFLGEPRMNFISRDQLHNDSRYTSLRASLTQAGSATGSTHDLDLSLGIRPENVYLSDPPSGEVAEQDPSQLSDEIRFELGVIEPLGNVYELNLLHDDDYFIVLTTDRPEGVSAGSDVGVRFDRTAIHAFDSDGNAIDLQIEEGRDR